MAIDPVSLGLGVAGSLAKGITGFAQFRKGKKVLEGAKRPEYEIPEEIASNLSEAQRIALRGLPEEQRRQYIENIDRQTGAALSGFTSRKAGLTGLTGLAQTQNDAFKNLMVEDAAARQQGELAAMQARNVMASYRDKAFEYNKAQPYQQQVDEGQALQGAGMQNIFGGVDELAGTALMSGINGMRSATNNGMTEEEMNIDDITPEQLKLLRDLYKNNTIGRVNKYALGG